MMKKYLLSFLFALSVQSVNAGVTPLDGSPAKVNKAGDTMTGGLGLGTNITAGLGGGSLELDAANPQIIIEVGNAGQGFIGSAAGICTSGAATSLGVRGATSIQSCPGGTIMTTVNSNGFVVAGGSITTTGGLFGTSGLFTGKVGISAAPDGAGGGSPDFQINKDGAVLKIGDNGLTLREGGGTLDINNAAGSSGLWQFNASGYFKSAPAQKLCVGCGLSAVTPEYDLGATVATGNSIVASSSTASGFGVFHAFGTSGGCLMLRDTDNAGWTKCTALNGTLSCGTDADGVCD